MREQHMKYRRSFGMLALAICSAFATGPAIAAAPFPPGSYGGGAVTIKFGDSGQVQVTKGGTLEVDGSYAFKGDQLEVTDESGPWACTKPEEKTGTYHWKYAGGMLTFIPVADQCKDRAASLTSQSWKKQ
jgi:hypothetical protein